MKVVLLAGGFGTRISEESQFKPKPMIEIGGMPILWHIMKGYAHFGYTDFIICAGYLLTPVRCFCLFRAIIKTRSTQQLYIRKPCQI